MLVITVNGEELYDERIQEFVSTEDVVLRLEHSLVSLSKWESKFCKPFLGPEKKSREEVLEYIKAMVVGEDIPDEVFSRLGHKNIEKINEYISAENSATTFVETPQQKARGRSEIITAELIYFWMISYTVPMECENWHLNRLFALLKVCNIKNSKEKPMSAHEVAKRNRDINAQRREKLGTSG